MEISDEVIDKQVANRHVPVQEVAPPLISYLGLDLLFEVIEVGLADRVAQNLAGRRRKRVSFLVAEEGFP